MSKFRQAILRQEDRIRKMYHGEEMTQEEIADELGCSSGYLCKVMQDMNIKTRRKGARNGEKHPRWNGGLRERPWSWRKKRKKALERDDYECRNCGIAENEHKERYNQSLHVHHKTPYASFDSPERANQLDNLITYCIKCHREIESRRTRK